MEYKKQVEYKKLADGFLIRDLADAPVCAGQVRLAPKILRSGAEQLARSMTYLFAANKMEIGGASAGINATPDKREEALSGFLKSLSNEGSFSYQDSPLTGEDSASGGIFLPFAGKGISEKDFEAVLGDDPRTEARLRDMGGCNLAEYCTGVSAVAAINKLLANGGNGIGGGKSKKNGGGDMAGKSVCIEGFGANALGALAELEKAGAKLTGISNDKGFIHNPAGININQAASAYREHGNSFLNHLDPGAKPASDSEPASNLKPAKEIFQVEADILFLGSKMGVLDHEMAEGLKISALGSLHPIPFTTRALMILEGKGVIVPPDFLCLGGMIYASWHLSEKTKKEPIKPTKEPTKEGEPDTNEIISATIQKTHALVEEVVDGVMEAEPRLFLAGCKIAEDFLKTWQEKIPFGRPLA